MSNSIMPSAKSAVAGLMRNSEVPAGLPKELKAPPGSGCANFRTEDLPAASTMVGLPLYVVHLASEEPLKSSYTVGPLKGSNQIERKVLALAVLSKGEIESTSKLVTPKRTKRDLSFIIGSSKCLLKAI